MTLLNSTNDFHIPHVSTKHSELDQDTGPNLAITTQGKILGTVLMMIGMVFFALPMSIIYKTFMVEYERYFLICKAI